MTLDLVWPVMPSSCNSGGENAQHNRLVPPTTIWGNAANGGETIWGIATFCAEKFWGNATNRLKTIWGIATGERIVGETLVKRK